MFSHFTNTQLIVAAVVLVFLVVVAVVAFVQRRRTTHRGLPQSFRIGIRPRCSEARLLAARPKQNWPTGKPAWKH